MAENVWPYVVGDYAALPPPDIETEKHYKISRLEPVKNVQDLKTALEKYGPDIGVITLYNSIRRDDVAKSGMIPMPDPNETVFGADAVCFVGFNDSTQLFKYQSHWRVEWGEHGYGYISYRQTDKFFSDGFVIISLCE